MTHYKPPTKNIENEDELINTLQWYFRHVKQLIIPGQFTKYLARNNIRTYEPISPRRIERICRTHEDFGVDNRNRRPRYYMKGEYGNGC